MSRKSTGPRPYINPYLGGSLLGVVLFLAFFITGGGLGASGAITRVQTGLVDAVAPRHVDQVAYLAETAGGSKNPFDHSSVFMLLGTLAGGAVSGLLGRRFTPEVRKGPNAKTATRLAQIGRAHV